jgi:prevent-host-death family protein
MSPASLAGSIQKSCGQSTSHKERTLQEIGISDFKATCLALLEEVSKTKKPILITRHGKPVAEVVPPSPVRKGRKFLGATADSFDILDNDIVGPIIDFKEMESFRD